MRRDIRGLAVCLGTLIGAGPAAGALADDVAAPTDAALHAALKAAKPGDTIRLSAGPYKGGFFATSVAGTKDKPVVISGPAADKPAVFANASGGILHLPGAQYVTVENIHVTRAGNPAGVNALAFDDAGKMDWSCHHITVRHVTVENVGPKNTSNAVKLAGVTDWVVADSTFRDWGTEGGAAVDAVGCKNGLIERCTLLPGRNGWGGTVGIQLKGGADAITVRQCTFDDCAPRAINCGGATGMAFFRPKPQGFEARAITIEGNVFIGCEAAIAFPGTDGATVRFNTIYHPKKWAFRILQETRAEGFVPSRNVHIERNVIAFKSTQWGEGGINIGSGTAPETYVFDANAWFCTDSAGKSAPRLPSAEKAPLIGKDPQFVDPAKKDFALRPGSPATGKGHTACKAAAGG